MSNSFEKSVKGGTKIKLAAPKAKYVEHILVATHAGEAGVAEIFRALQNRLRDSTWTIVFKALIIVHLMIREGEPNVTLKYLSDSPSKLAISNFSDVQMQGTNIRHYYGYVLSRAKAFRDTKVDWVREGQSRLKKQTVSKGLLRETKTVQMQINALLKCDFLSNDPENEITLTAFRLLTMDLLILFGIMNEGTINVLGMEYDALGETLILTSTEHYFEMSKYDAEQALEIYKTFSKQTDRVVQFLSIARQYENSTRLEIPKLKHAPTSLTSSLEEYLNDPDFEINRRQYLAQQEAKKGKGATAGGSSKPVPKAQSGASTKDFLESKQAGAAPITTSSRPEPKGPAPDLIDFFDSIEDKQQPMATQPGQMQGFQNHPQFQQQPQPTGFPSSAPNPFLQNGALQQQQQQATSFDPQSNLYGPAQNQTQQPMQPNFSGASFGDISQQPFGQQSQFGSLPQSNPQQAYVPQQQPLQQFNTGQQSFDLSSQSPQSTNPFRQLSMPTGASTSTFSNSPTVSSPQSQRGTNPFARPGPSSLSNQSQATSFTSIPQQQTSQSFSQQSQSPFQQQPQQSLPPQTSQPFPQQQQQPPFSQPPQPHRTGTNPFARNITPSTQNSTPPPMMPNMTGSTNPFRQSTFMNQQTGQGWQSNQGSMGGLEQLNTVPVFPRPGQPQQSQQQGHPWP
ncbi:MAG: hypothetical protein Q9218_004938 [Villophora microphyllina]